MRDFLPAEVRKRNYVIGIIREVYEKYGFEPLETPSVENLETLTGKYGEEGNQLMFKILKRGEKLQQELAEGKIKSENELSDLALRYDLTVPLARVVANYRNELPKFFKRYQIQPVWRADRPAKGRYREFYQCDVDAIGSTSMITEAELISAVSEILERIGFSDFTIRINHRDILRGMLNAVRIEEAKHTDALVALDKLDKIGKDGVLKEFAMRGIDENAGVKLLDLFETLESAGNSQTLERLSEFMSGQETGQKGVNEISQILKFSERKNIKVDPSLARGLSYYTGAIFEVVLTSGDFQNRCRQRRRSNHKEVVLTSGDFQGSIAGGGRYDGLIGMFGKEQIPAVGFSIGLERILFVMEERGMFPAELTASPADVMVTLWNEESAAESLKLAGELRSKNLRVLVYPEADKLGKQFKYADSLKIPYVCVLGDAELAEGKVTLKNMRTGEQTTASRAEIAEKLKADE